MQRYFTPHNTFIQSDGLPDFIKSYNHHFHKTIHARPVNVNSSNSPQVWKTMYGDFFQIKAAASLFRKYDNVRMSKNKDRFGKCYKQTFTNEFFTVDEVVKHVCPLPHLVPKRLLIQTYHRFFLLCIPSLTVPTQAILKTVLSHQASYIQPHSTLPLGDVPNNSVFLMLKKYGKQQFHPSHAAAYVTKCCISCIPVYVGYPGCICHMQRHQLQIHKVKLL